MQVCINMNNVMTHGLLSGWLALGIRHEGSEKDYSASRRSNVLEGFYVMSATHSKKRFSRLMSSEPFFIMTVQIFLAQLPHDSFTRKKQA